MLSSSFTHLTSLSSAQLKLLPFLKLLPNSRKLIAKLLLHQQVCKLKYWSNFYGVLDSVFSHLAWTNTDRKQGGLGEMKIPILADTNHAVSKAYGCLKEDEGIAFRGLYIIDGKGIFVTKSWAGVSLIVFVRNNLHFRCSSSNHNQRFASWSICWRNTPIGSSFPIRWWTWRSLSSWMEARQGYNEGWSKGIKRIFLKAIRDLNDWNTLITDTFEGISPRPTIISLKILTKNVLTLNS